MVNTGLNFSSGTQNYTTGNTATIIDAGLTLNSGTDSIQSLDEVKVTITNVKAGDILGIKIDEQNLQSSGEFTFENNTYNLAYDENTGVLSITGVAGTDAYEKILRLVGYQNTSDNPDSEARQIQFSLGSNIANPDNNHFYEFVSNDGISWTDAQATADSSNYFGIQGYLTTITSAQEQVFVEEKLKGNGWIGANDADVEGEWRWVAGPENGTQFWSGTGISGNVVDNQYNNWRRNNEDPTESATNEPNNDNPAQDEDYAHLIGNLAVDDGNAIGKWNDLGNIETNTGFVPQGYIIEYGGLDGDPDVVLSDSLTLNIETDIDGGGDGNIIDGGVSTWEAKAVEDFGANSKADILWYNKQDGQVVLWQMDGTTATSKDVIATIAPDTGWKIVDAADSDSDNKADIFWQNDQSGEVGLWKMDGQNIIDQSVIATPDPSPGWEIVEAEDMDGDGNSDIIWRNSSSGRNAIWRLEGKEVLEYTYLLDVPDTDWKIVAASDMNGDGKSDIIWRNDNAGSVAYPSKNAIWLMDGTDVLDYVYLPNVDDANWTITGADDMNGNGKADIIWRNTNDGQNAIWEMNGTDVVEYSFIESIPNVAWNTVGTGDFDSDRNADILWRNGGQFDPSNNAIWRMDGSVVLEQTFIDPLV